MIHAPRHANPIVLIAAALSLMVAASSCSAYGQDADNAVLEMEAAIVERPYYSYRQELFRKYALEMLIRGTPERGLTVVARSLRSEFGRGDNQLNSHRNTQIYLQAADAYLLLRKAYLHRRELTFNEEPARWFFNTAQNLREFLDLLTAGDNLPQCWKIVETLHAHDPRGREHFRKLILALSVVWDQPRPPLHYQMADKRPAFDTDIKARYDYFKNLYTSGRAQMRYREIPTAALAFVVDTPVSVEELEWALENIDGYGRNWGEKFTEIEYDDERIERAQYQWPHQDYTLAAIQKYGGICVEQGYYATISARAHGIPALFFVGQGRRGPHAWMGFMQSRGRWVLDVGRYERDKYATGHAVNPQTNKTMTDHDVTYMCDRAANPSRYQMAAAYARLGMVLAELGFSDAATQAASSSAAELPIYELPWRIQEAILRRKNDIEGLMKLLDAKANAFRQYPDFVANIRQKQAQILYIAGMEDRAGYFLQRHKSLVSNNRDDLQRFLASEQIRMAYINGDYAKARQQFEALLREQQDEGSKMLWLLEAYLDFTEKTDQQKEAAHFLRRYISGLSRRYEGEENKFILNQFLARAYRNAGMENEALRLERRMK